MYPKESRTGINRYPHAQTLTQRRPTFLHFLIITGCVSNVPDDLQKNRTIHRANSQTLWQARVYLLLWLPFETPSGLLPAQCFPRLWNKTKPGQEALHALATQEADDAAASKELSCCPAPAVSCSAATLVVAAALLLLPLLQLFATSFSQQIASKNAPPGRENTMALRDGMVPCNDNPWGLTSLLKP